MSSGGNGESGLAPAPKGESARARRGFRASKLFDLVYASAWPWAVVFAIGLTALLTPGLNVRVDSYELGQIATANIRAPYDFSLEDVQTTEARREEAMLAVLEVYNFNETVLTDARSRIASAFELARQTLEEPDSEDAEPSEPASSAPAPMPGSAGGLSSLSPAPATPEELRAAMQEALGVSLSAGEFELLRESEFSIELERLLTRTLSTVLSRDVVASKERLLATGRPITRREVVSRRSQVRRDLSSILSTDEARELLEVQLGLSELPPAKWRRLAVLGARFIEPTLTFDFAETERRRFTARENVDPVYFLVRRGKTIVRAGDEITEGVLRQLDYLASDRSRGWGISGAIGALLLSLVILMVQWYLLRPSRTGALWRRQTFALVGLVVVGHVALARVMFFVARLFSEQIVTMPFNNASSYGYALPFASVAVLILMLEHTPTALLASTLFTVAIGVMTGNLQLAVFCLLSCLAAILGLFQYKRRTALFKLGLMVGSVNFAVVLAIDLLSGRYFPVINFAFDLLCAFLGGVTMLLVVSFLLPAFELFFRRTTDIRLLELANNNVPVLRRLALEAPGTYHHSMVVGSLAEAAAEAIGANAVFCRTAAMYHDIGKLTKVSYFVENQVGPNKHDKLSPRMSALIIASHVKEGIEMGKEIDLPQEIIDCIPQHHGTKLITYFYEKAKEDQDPALGEISEEEFRYPGPKPQTKEAGIIMIADAVEAASRTLGEPSPARLKGLIRQIIDYIFLDGQLNECDLTLRDLEKISSAFLRVLMGIHHHRVAYPGFDFEKQTQPVVVQDSR